MSREYHSPDDAKVRYLVFHFLAGVRYKRRLCRWRKLSSTSPILDIDRSNVEPYTKKQRGDYKGGSKIVNARIRAGKQKVYFVTLNSGKRTRWVNK